MDINDDEEETCRIHVNIADHPAMVHITHNPFNSIKRIINMGGVAHRQHNAGDDHDGQ